MDLTLAELKKAMSAYTAAFDAAVVHPGQLREVLGDAGAIERMASTVSALVAARLARGPVEGGREGEEQERGQKRAEKGARAGRTGRRATRGPGAPREARAAGGSEGGRGR